MIDHFKLIFTLALLPAIVGCESIGASRLSPERMDYADAIRNSEAEQLLKNMLRLRFGSSPELLALTQVVTQYQLEAGGSAGASIATGDNTYPFSIDASIQESPTITYAPVTGQDFALRMLTPIQPWQFYLLSRSGWDLDRLMCATVQDLNGLQNLQTSIGLSRIPTPDSLAEFAEAAALLEELEINRQIKMTVTSAKHVHQDTSSDQQGSKSTDDSNSKSINTYSFDGLKYHLYFLNHGPNDVWAPKKERLKSLLGLRQDMDLFPVISSELNYGTESDSAIVLANRSILSVMLYLTAGIEIPPELAPLAPPVYTVVPELKGISTTEFIVYPSSLLTVHSGRERPGSACVAVRHEGYWFWIDSIDRNSKTTFALLEYLLRLQEAKSSSTSPGVLLTIPTR